MYARCDSTRIMSFHPITRYRGSWFYYEIERISDVYSNIFTYNNNFCIETFFIYKVPIQSLNISLLLLSSKNIYYFFFFLSIVSVIGEIPINVKSEKGKIISLLIHEL